MALTLAFSKTIMAQAKRFENSIHLQLEINKARTPTERFQALCDLLDIARAMAPRDEASRQRRLRALIDRNRRKEQFREQLRRIIAAQGADAGESV